jgi:MFS-type transporter involved in bile tolerance (Atg22 family)
VAALTNNERASIVSLVILFAIGGVLLWRVRLTPPAA